MKNLIVNADDFGLNPYINEGIIKGHVEGLITSASLMCSADGFYDAVSLAKDFPKLGLGVHLTLVGNVKPVLPLERVSTLVNKDGVFFDNYTQFAVRLYSGMISKKQIRDELSAQINKAILEKINITHLDSHQHVHVLPGMQDLVVELAKRYDIKAIRVPGEAYDFTGGFECSAGRKIGKNALTFFSNKLKEKATAAELAFPEHFFGMIAGGNLNKDLVSNILIALPEGTSEIMTHPGLNNEYLRTKFSWGYHWEEELAAFLCKKNRDLIDEEDIMMINYAHLQGINTLKNISERIKK